MTQDFLRTHDSKGAATILPVALDPEPVAAVPRDFADAVLAAITEMAGLSPRRQADVAVAMRRAGLSAAPALVAAAVAQLHQEGCIDRPLQLSDGGVLVSVTSRAIEILATTSHRHVLQPFLR